MSFNESIYNKMFKKNSRQHGLKHILSKTRRKLWDKIVAEIIFFPPKSWKIRSLESVKHDDLVKVVSPESNERQFKGTGLKEQKRRVGLSSPITPESITWSLSSTFTERKAGRSRRSRRSPVGFQKVKTFKDLLLQSAILTLCWNVWSGFLFLFTRRHFQNNSRLFLKNDPLKRPKRKKNPKITTNKKKLVWRIYKNGLLKKGASK